MAISSFVSGFVGLVGCGFGLLFFSVFVCLFFVGFVWLVFICLFCLSGLIWGFLDFI